jgi:hypothetical protein
MACKELRTIITEVSGDKIGHMGIADRVVMLASTLLVSACTDQPGQHAVSVPWQSRSAQRNSPDSIAP